jgi:hypothetical protein
MTYPIVTNGICRYSVVCAKTADETVRYACNELRRFLFECTGAAVPVLSDICPYTRPELRIGPDVRDDPFYRTLDIAALGDEGFTIRTHGSDIYIIGGGSRGTLYGVYAFLERFLGCRWFTPTVSRIPKRRELILEDVDITERPAFESRDAYWGSAFDGTFCARNRLTSSKALIANEQGGKLRWFNFHHAMYDLVPPGKYAQEHPEYYALVDGKRLTEHAQLCLSNPDVVRIAAETLKGWIRANPDCTVFSVAQNDGSGYCTCDACRALDEAEGTPCASLLNFANQLADAVRGEFPHVLLHTFAYYYSVVPPKTLRPRENVIVRLCNISCDFGRPFTEGARLDPKPYTREFIESLEKWGQIAPRLYIWDYCTDFRCYLQPFPNLDALGENIRLYRDMGVRGVFMEGDFSHGCAAYMNELQVYLQARLMWNPDLDIKEETDVFLSGYYGNAAPYIRRFLDLTQAAVRDAYRDPAFRMTIYEWPDSAFIADAYVDEAERLMNMAAAAAEDDAVRYRVERTRLSVEFLKLTRMPTDTPMRSALIDAFGQKLRKYGVSEITERGWLDPSIEGLKKSRYARDIRDNYLWMYYRM